jgi:hypothetical protein
VSTFATILSTRVLRIVAKVLTTKVKNEGLSPRSCHLHITAPFRSTMSVLRIVAKVLTTKVKNEGSVTYVRNSKAIPCTCDVRHDIVLRKGAVM